MRTVWLTIVLTFAATPLAASQCRPGYYLNRSGTCVYRPHVVTALCNDGEYSSSLHANGTCSRHGGVKAWTKRNALE